MRIKACIPGNVTKQAVTFVPVKPLVKRIYQQHRLFLSVRRELRQHIDEVAACTHLIKHRIEHSVLLQFVCKMIQFSGLPRMCLGKNNTPQAVTVRNTGYKFGKRKRSVSVRICKSVCHASVVIHPGTCARHVSGNFRKLFYASRHIYSLTYTAFHITYVTGDTDYVILFGSNITDIV